VVNIARFVESVCDGKTPIPFFARFEWLNSEQESARQETQGGPEISACVPRRGIACPRSIGLCHQQRDWKIGKQLSGPDRCRSMDAGF
jgi:hypothetical protein